MSRFNRRLSRLEALGALDEQPQWWHHLLSLWRPSGVGAGEYGLRLTLRDNYLNFYRRGQSVARVTLGSNGEPWAEVHIKYVDGDRGATHGQEYVKLRGNTALGKRGFSKTYEGMQTLKSWIKIAEGHAGKEKRLIDQVVASNPNVIDLEMGLPAWGEQKTAPRMDIVEIDTSSSCHNVVFWEAKVVTDSRARCRSDVVLDEKPEVLRQLAVYRRFLSEETHRQVVAGAYQNTAKVLVKLRRMADQLGESYPLGRGILAVAAGAELEIEQQPRLLVFNGNDAKTTWEVHAEKLRTAGIPLTVIEENGPYHLRPSA